MILHKQAWQDSWSTSQHSLTVFRTTSDKKTSSSWDLVRSMIICSVIKDAESRAPQVQDYTRLQFPADELHVPDYLWQSSKRETGVCLPLEATLLTPTNSKHDAIIDTCIKEPTVKSVQHTNLKTSIIRAKFRQERIRGHNSQQGSWGHPQGCRAQPCPRDRRRHQQPWCRYHHRHDRRERHCQKEAIISVHYSCHWKEAYAAILEKIGESNE
jgi:hypothetical protein